MKSKKLTLFYEFIRNHGVSLLSSNNLIVFLFSVMKPVFGSQYSLSGSQCCQNCHILGAPIRRGFLDKWHSQSTVIFLPLLPKNQA